MARNSSGTHSLPAGNPVVSGTPASSSVQNNTMSDISAEITDSLSRSNKGAMLAPLELANGTVGAPALSFGTDTDTGAYRIGANNIGIAAGGAKVLDVATTGLSVTGTLTPSGVTKLADGAVGAPGMTFASDTDSGMYRIGANNVGVAVNGAKVLDVATTGLSVTGNVTFSGSNPASTTAFTKTATPSSITKAWALINYTGASHVLSVTTGFAVASVAADGGTGDIVVTLAQAMASTDFAVIVSGENQFVIWSCPARPSTTTFRLHAYDVNATSDINFTSSNAARNVHVMVLGLQ